MLARLTLAAVALGVFAVTSRAPQWIGSNPQTLRASSSFGYEAEMVYRLKPSGETGAEDPGPVLASGYLKIRQSRRVRGVIPLSALKATDEFGYPRFFQIAEACRAGTPLSFRQTATRERYLVVERIMVGKGCQPVVSLVDLRTFKLVPEASLDHPFAHRYEVGIPSFRPSRMFKVAKTESFEIPSSSVGGLRTPWILWVVSASSRQPASPKLFMEDLRPTERPVPDEMLTIGRLSTRELLTTGRLWTRSVLRLSHSHERAWAIQQSPTPRAVERNVRYNNYFMLSNRLADSGDFAAALLMFKKALSYLGDTSLRAAESASIPKRQKLVDEVSSGKITKKEALKQWYLM